MNLPLVGKSPSERERESLVVHRDDFILANTTVADFTKSIFNHAGRFWCVWGLQLRVVRVGLNCLFKLDRFATELGILPGQKGRRTHARTAVIGSNTTGIMEKKASTSYYSVLSITLRLERLLADSLHLWSFLAAVKHDQYP